MSSRSGPSSARDKPGGGGGHHQQRQSADDQQVPAQLVDRREGLGGVDLGDERPLDAGNRERSPRSERRDATVADDLARALDAGERGPGRLGVDALMQHRRPVALDGGDLLVRGAAGLELGEVVVAILVERPRAGAHQIVGPDEIGLARGAEPFLAPAAIAGHDVVDLLVRQLRDQHADDDALVDHRRRHEGDRRAARRRIGGEILEADGRPVGSGGAAGDGGGDVGAAVGTDLEGRGEIHLLLDRVDQAAGFGVGHHEVEEADRRGGGAHQRMIDGVQPAVVAAVAGIVEQLAPLRRMRIGDDVVVLEIVGSGADRQVVGESRLPAENARHLGDEVLGVPVADLLAQLGRRACPVELVDRGPELARRVDHHLGGGKEAQLGMDRAEVGLDLARLGLTGGRELVEDRLFQGVAGAEVAEHAGDQDRDRAQQEQGRKQLCGQAPARGAG